MPAATPVIANFRRQADYCRALGSPFTAALLDLAATRIEAGAPWAAPLQNWPGDPQADALALRLAGALHRAVLEGDAELAGRYAARQIDAASLDAALLRHQTLLAEYLQRPPQTNDPQRSAVLLGGFLQLARDGGGRPLQICEIGASAGLNQSWLRYAYDFASWRWGDPHTAPLLLRAAWHGAAPPQTQPVVLSRAGCDIAPLRADVAADRQRLLSYIWADQPERLERVRRALDFAAREGIVVQSEAAADFVARGLRQRAPDAVFVLCHSIVWQYIAPAEQQRIASLMQAAGEAATPQAPLAWLRFEPGATPEGADLTLTLWPGGTTRHLALGDFHGRWVRWMA